MLTGFEAQPGMQQVYFVEAEDADSMGPEMVFTDVWTAFNNQPLLNETSGTGYIHSDPNLTADATSEPNDLGIASYIFTVEEDGQYIVNLREAAFFNGGWKNSFWVRIAGDDVTTNIDADLGEDGWINFNEFERGFTGGVGYWWVWDQVHNDLSSVYTPVTFTLPAGTYTLEIAYRERGAKLDAIEIVKVGN